MLDGSFVPPQRYPRSPLQQRCLMALNPPRHTCQTPPAPSENTSSSPAMEPSHPSPAQLRKPQPAKGPRQQARGRGRHIWEGASSAPADRFLKISSVMPRHPPANPAFREQIKCSGNAPSSGHPHRSGVFSSAPRDMDGGQPSPMIRVTTRGSQTPRGQRFGPRARISTLPRFKKRKPMLE